MPSLSPFIKHQNPAVALSSSCVNSARTTTSLRMGSYREEFVDPEMWNAAPIIDWDKFYAQDPDGKMPKTYDPPQRYGLDLAMSLGSPRFDGLHWYSCLAPKLSPEEISKTNKPYAAEITGDLFEKILGPAPDATKVPEPFRNSLLWMYGNPASEEFLSLNRCAWRSQTGGNGRVIGLGNMLDDWSADPTPWAKQIGTENALFWHSWQQSPCKKWLKCYFFLGDMTFLGWLTVYVVQEGDVFVDRLGEPLSFIKPGDCIRITYTNNRDPYECSPANIALMYLFRRVAIYDEETGKVKTNSPHYEALLDKVAASPPENLTSFEYCTKQERFDIVTSTVLDTQMFMPAPTPPTGDAIENL